MTRALPLAVLLFLAPAIRAAELSDLYRPRLHFTAPDDWINDPNGLFRVGPD